MMKKLLPILWVVIIIGVVFISIQLTKPNSQNELDLNLSVHESPAEVDLETITIDASDPDPTNKTYSEYIVKADKYFDEEEYGKAVKYYEYAVNLNPNSTNPLIKLANAYIKNNQPENAKEIYKKALGLDPQSPEIQLGLVNAYLNLRDAENAKNIIWRMDSQNPQVKYYTGLILILYQDFEGAKTKFTEIVENQEVAAPEDLAAKSQTFLNAYKTFEYFAEGDPLHLETLLAKAFTENGHYQAAIPLLYDVINQKNNYRDAWIILGYAYLNTDNAPNAIDALKKAKDLDPEKPETLFFLGLAYFANDEIDNAISYLQQADKYGFEPKEQIDLKLGDLYLLKQEYEKSAARYEKVIAKNKSNLDVFVRAVWLNIDKLDDKEKAFNLAQEAMENHPDDAMSFNLVGWAYAANDELSEGKNYLTIALELDPNLDAANLNLGWIYEQEGETDLAKEYYKKAYFLGQGNSIANLAGQRFNRLSEAEKNRFYRTNVTSP